MQKLIARLLKNNKPFKWIAIIVTVIVIYLSLKPPSLNNESWNFLFIRGDLFLHFFCYLNLSIIYYCALFDQNKAIEKTLFFASSLGLILELLQLIPQLNRFFDLQDLFANFLGCWVAVYFNKFLFRFSIKN